MSHFSNNRIYVLYALAAAGVAGLVFLAGWYSGISEKVFIIVAAVLAGTLTLMLSHWLQLRRELYAGKYGSQLITAALHGREDGLVEVDPSVPTCWKVKPCYFTQCPVYGREHVRCWLVDGTYCPDKQDGCFPDKLDGCFRCEVYQAAVGGDPVKEMGERFHCMMRMLEERDSLAEEQLRRSERQRQALEYLFDVSRQALSSLELDALLGALMKQIISQSTDFAAFLILSRDGVLELHAQEGFRPGVYPKLYDTDGHDLIEKVMHGDDLISIQKIAREPWIVSQFAAERYPNWAVGVPLMNRDERLGMLLAGTFRKEPYSEDEKRIFQVTGDQIAMAVANASMYEVVSRMAATDGLTGLANHRAFYEAVDKELGRSQRYNRPLSLLMVDIDNFKQFNDTFGHPQGDKALTEIAKIIRDSVRATDTAARYGGEEFAVLLPETPCESDFGDVDGSALHVAERMRLAVEAHAFEGRPGQRNAKITVSVGVAEHPQHAPGLSELVYAADVALYEAKRNGRNRVELSGRSQERQGIAS
ncbi:MAG: GGDEF domain-containing protein [Thermoleophilia bacterium]